MTDEQYDQVKSRELRAGKIIIIMLILISLSVYILTM